MEQLNKVQLKGFVGNVHKTQVGEKTSFVRFSVATDYSYIDRQGNAIVETTWHQCVAWGDTISDAEKLKRGDNVDLSGRIRAQKYIDADGNDRQVYEIYVQYLKIL